MKTNNVGGRPPIVLTDEQISEIEGLAAYLNTEQISDYFGISRDTFCEIRKRNPEVCLQYKKGKARKILQFAQMLEGKAKGNTDGEAACIMFYLKTQAGWREKQEVEKVVEPVHRLHTREELEERLVLLEKVIEAEDRAKIINQEEKDE